LDKQRQCGDVNRRGRRGRGCSELFEQSNPTELLPACPSSRIERKATELLPAPLGRSVEWKATELLPACPSSRIERKATELLPTSSLRHRLKHLTHE
jgi:hypothetical protein